MPKTGRYHYSRLDATLPTARGRSNLVDTRAFGTPFAIVAADIGGGWWCGKCDSLINTGGCFICVDTYFMLH
jgi:hypothetical protein